MSDIPDPITTATAKLLESSKDWRHAAGWVVVLVLAWRFLIYPIANVIVVAQGNHTLPPLDPLSMGDAAALAGIPLVGLLVRKN